MYTKVSLRRLPNVCCWLESEVQPPEIEVRLYLSFRHSGQGCEGLKVTPTGPYNESIESGGSEEQLLYFPSNQSPSWLFR
jgi:hypothetical protein